MKKWIVYVLMSSFAAGFAVAEDNSPWWKLGKGNKDSVETPAPEQPKPARPMEGRSDMKKQQQRRGQMTQEQRGKMKAHFQAVQTLADQARNEVDPVKKEELIAQLRAKLTDGAEKMQNEFRKRLEVAEVEVKKMKKRLAEQEKGLEKRVEEQLQRLLSGEKPSRGGHGKHLGGDRPSSE